jgi:hypothetical protein
MTPDQEAQIQSNIGKILANLDNIGGDTKLLREVINGNGHPEEGMVYRLAIVEKTQRDCPITQVAADIKLIKDGLKISDAQAQGAANATAGAVLIKYEPIKKFLDKIWPIIKHPAAIVIYLLTATGGTVAMNWKGILKAIIAAVVENYKNGGGQ